MGAPARATIETFARAEELVQQGFRDMDALHLALAEHLKAAYFATVDDELLTRSGKARLGVKVTDVIDLVQELQL